jgi:hypothetical protein
VKRAIIILSLLSSLPVLATQPTSNNGNGPSNSSAESASAAQAGAVAGALSSAVNSTSVQAGAIAGAVTGPSTSAATGGRSSATGGNSTASGGAAGDSTASVTYNAPAAPASTRATVKSAPDIFVSGPASGPCTGASGGVAASWLGGGFGFNAATIDDACTLRENIRVLSMILQTLPAIEAAEVRILIMVAVRQLTAPKATAAGSVVAP